MDSNHISRLITKQFVCLLVAFLATLGADAFTVVVDAGHGGKDAGCVGTSIKEKDINLAVAQRVAKLLSKQKDVKVVMTRSTDVFLPLQQRCDIANAAKGDIFVSIHTNSLPETAAGRENKKGASVYTMGLSRAETNLEVAKRENSVIKLEDDYSTKYDGFDPNSTESYIIFELAQNNHIEQSLNLASSICNEMASSAGRVNLGVKQEPFWVLVRTSMPSVLVELDFICNPEVEEFLGSDRGRDSLAEAITTGILNYKNGKPSVSKKGNRPSRGLRRTEDIVDEPVKQKNADKPKRDKKEDRRDEVASRHVAPGVTTYRIQFLTSNRLLRASDERISNFTDTVNHYTQNGIIKYTVGDFTSINEAQKVLTSVKERYPDAFIITWRDGERIK